MILSTEFGPDLAKVLRDQARASRAARAAEARAIALCGGPGMSSAGWTQTRGAASTREVFGMTAAQMCGCGAPTCDNCGTNCCSGGPCGCGLVSCRSCISGARTAMMRAPSAADTHGAALPKAGQTAYFMPPPSDPQDPRDPGDLPGAAGDATWRGFMDMHSHIHPSIARGQEDWDDALRGLTTDVDFYADWLRAMEIRWQTDGVPVTGMVLSAQYPGDPNLTYAKTLDDITWRAFERHSDFFVPFVRGFELGPAGLTTSADELAEYVRERLAAGFEGVGELFVRAYGGDTGDHNESNDPNWLDKLVAIGRVAASYGVPVLVHWDIGKVMQYDAAVSRKNFEDLKAFLDEFPNEPIVDYEYGLNDPRPLKLILAHAGLGPRKSPIVDADPGYYSDEDIARWLEHIEALLGTYHNVWVDLSGQVGNLMNTTTGVLSPMGDAVITVMGRYPERFMLGIDANYFTTGLSFWPESIPHYPMFLDQALASGAITGVDDWRIRLANAPHALYDRARPAMVLSGAPLEDFRLGEGTKLSTGDYLDPGTSPRWELSERITRFLTGRSPSPAAVRLPWWWKP
jgi:hypothetical protein